MESVKIFIETFGLKFLLCISFIIHILKGFLFGGGSQGLIGSGVMFIFRDDYGLSDIRIQILKTITLLPFSLKPLFGLLSDTITIDGYHKKWYMIFSLILSSISCLLITIIWTHNLNPELFTLLLIIVYISIGVTDLLTEAKYSEKIKIFHDQGPKLISFVIGGLFLGEMLSIILSGLLIHINQKRILYLISCIPLMLLILPIYSNWLEDTQKNSRIIDINFKSIKEHWKINILSLLICFLSIEISILGLLQIRIEYLFLNSLLISIIMIIAFNQLTNSLFAKIQTFVIIQNMFTVSIEAGSFFFFTDSEDSFPGGPHFSTFFYVTIIGLIASIFGMLGSILYDLLFKNFNYRSIFWITNLLYMFVSLLNIVIFTRLNIILGIPDKLFILGAEATQHIISVWNYIPMMLLMSHLSYKGRESTSFAILAGSSNLGYGLSSIQGAFLLHLLKINSNGGINDFMSFQNLWIASLISAILPCIPLFLIQYFIPNKNQQDSINEEEEKSIYLT